MRALFIDPGLDAAGFALFDTAGLGGGADALRAWRQSFHLTTDAAFPLPTRLRALATETQTEARRLFPLDRIVIEHPRHDGEHRAIGRKNRRAVNSLFMAIGALMAGAEQAYPGKVHLELAGKERKAARMAFLEAVAQQAGVQLPVGPRGGITGGIADERDAIYLGWHTLTHTKGRDW